METKLQHNTNMKKITMLFAVLFSFATALSAQEAALRKYTVMDDVKTTSISKGMISLLPLGNLDSYGLGRIIDKIESLQVITTNKKKIAKKMVKKLPKELLADDFDVKISTKQAGKDIRVMQKNSDLSAVVVIISELPTATVINVKGDFTGEDFNF